MNSLRIEGQKTVGIEIVQQFDWEVPDWIVIPGGNLGNVSALAKGLDMMVELGLVDAAPAHRVRAGRGGQPALPRVPARLRDLRADRGAADARVGDPDRQPGLDREGDRRDPRYDGIVEQASETELAEACAHADRTGLFNCPHTGVALAATEKLVERGVIRKSDRVVVISTAHGLKFVDFKVKYHEMPLEGIELGAAEPADRAAGALRRRARRRCCAQIERARSASE